MGCSKTSGSDEYKESLEFAADQNDMMRLSRIHVQSLSCAQ